MPTDLGTQVVTAAGTREPLTNDLNASAIVSATTRVKSIAVIAASGNTGIVYLGLVTVSATYGWPLAPGDELSIPLDAQAFGDFYVDAATSGDSLSWAVVFEPGKA